MELGSLQYIDTEASLEHCNDLASENMLELSPSPRVYSLPCLESLTIHICHKIRFVPAQLDTLMHLSIISCSGLESLDCLGDLPLLRTLFLGDCKHLISVPGSAGNYSALEKIGIKCCPALNMKPLYGHLQRRHNSLELKDISYAGAILPSEGPQLWEPKSWKYAIPGLREHAFKKMC